MAFVSPELSKKRGERVKELINKSKSEQKGKRITQKKIADMLGIEVTNLNAKINGPRSLSDDDIDKISTLFPNVRVNYLKGYDDYPTENDVLDAMLTEHDARYERRIITLKTLLEPRKFEFVLYSSGEMIGSSGGYEDIFILRRGANQRYIAYSEIEFMLDDIRDFAELRFNRLLRERRGKDNG